MLRLKRLPAMRQQLLYSVVLLGWKASQNIFQVSIRIMPIELGALNQTHHRSGPLPCTKRACKQPIVSADGNRANLALDPVIVDGQLPIIEESGQCSPALWR